MNTIKELMNDVELMQNIVEDLEDYPEDTKVCYEVWALGYNSDGEITDDGMLLKDFNDPDEAVTYASKLELADIVELAEDPTIETVDKDIAFLSIEVETVICDFENEDCAVNVGTIYKKDINIYTYEPDDEEIIQLTEDDYILNPEGNMVISQGQFNHLNKNDIIKAQFIDEDNQPILTYKIVSETMSGTFLCEFIN